MILDDETLETIKEVCTKKKLRMSESEISTFYDIFKDLCGRRYLNNKTPHVHAALDVITSRRSDSPNILDTASLPVVDPAADPLIPAIFESAINDRPDNFPEIGFLRLKAGWVRAVAIDRDNESGLLNVVTLERHDSDGRLCVREEEGQAFYVGEKSLYRVPEQYFNSRSVGIPLSLSKEQCFYYGGFPEVEPMWLGSPESHTLLDSLGDDNKLCWIANAFFHGATDNIYSGSMAITTQQRLDSFQPSFITKSSPGQHIRKLLFDTYGDDPDLEGRYFVPALIKTIQSLRENPLPFSDEDKQRLRQLRQLFAPYGADGHVMSLEIVAALRWGSPFVFAENSDLFPFSPEGCAALEIPTPVAVLHEQPFPDFPFLGYTQLWGGEVFSIALDCDLATEMLKVVILDDYCLEGDGMYQFWRFDMFLICERYFKVLAKL